MDHHRTWDECIPHMLFAFRNAKSRSTGLSPAMVCLGRTLQGPVDLLMDTHHTDAESVKDYASKTLHRIQNAIKYLIEHRELATIEQKLTYDPHHRKSEFEEGDWVTLEAHPLSSKAKGITAALMPKRNGPYVIKKKMNPLNYELADPSTGEAITFAHVVQLRKYHARNKEETFGVTNKTVTEQTKKVPAIRLGLGKSRGRPKAKTKAAAPPKSPSPIRTTGMSTRTTTIVEN
jgi:hypothetical protein